MKITSELTNKEYASVEECLKAEAEFKAAKEQATAVKNSSEKKRLADIVESCDKAVEAAYQGLEKAKTTVRGMYTQAKKELSELIEKQNQEMKNVLQPAEKAVKDAEAARCNAISNFSKKFGAYKKIYTGEDAIKELKKTLNITSIFEFLDLL